jgi:DDE superfamily endonuclease
LQDIDNIFFSATKNGWTNDAYGLKWLQEVFEPSTRPKRLNSKRLLIIDGHSSYINLQLINWAEAHKIFILILPPYLTHRL